MAQLQVLKNQKEFSIVEPYCVAKERNHVEGCKAPENLIKTKFISASGFNDIATFEFHVCYKCNQGHEWYKKVLAIGKKKRNI